MDANHTMIVDALRSVGCTVQSLADIGGGCPDLLVGVDGKNLLAEVKDGSKAPSARRLTPDEAQWHAEWNGLVHIVSSVDEALQIVAEVRRVKKKAAGAS